VVGEQVSVVQVTTEIANLTSLDGAVLRSTVIDAAGNPVTSVETPAKTASQQQTLVLQGAQLWSIESPYLYTLRSEVFAAGALLDSEQTVFGVRVIEIDFEHGLRLNGVSLKMFGGCLHHDNGPLGAASYDRAEERKIQLLKSAGYNALRTAHNPPSPGLLDACDRLGFLVIDETFDAWTSPKVPNDYHLYFKEWWQRDTEAMVRRDRNHPSVILWSIGNEIFESLGNPVGTEWCQRQADFVRALDPTRLVTAGVMQNFLEDIANHDIEGSFKLKPTPADPEKDSWGKLTAAYNRPLDVIGYNYMAGRYSGDRERFPGRIIAGTETWGHFMYTSWTETLRHSNVIGDFVWVAWDHLGESGGGYVNFEGKVSMGGAPFPYHTSGIGDFDICGFRRPQSFYRDLLWGMRTAPYIGVVEPQHHGKPMGFSPWAWEPVLDTWTFPGQEGQLCQVDVYAIDDEVELFLNGVSVGRKPAGVGVQNKTTFDVVYQPGVLEAAGWTGGKETGRTRLVTSGAPAALRLSVDRAAIQASGGDLAYVTIEIQDQDGARIRQADPVISIEVSGAADLLAIGSGNPWSEELYVGSQHQAFQGRLLAILRSRPTAGAITLTARAEGLPDASIEIRAE
jgi:beta-galactosidase